MSGPIYADMCIESREVHVNGGDLPTLERVVRERFLVEDGEPASAVLKARSETPLQPLELGGMSFVFGR